MSVVRRLDGPVDPSRIIRRDFMMKRSRQVRMSQRRGFANLAGLFLAPNFQSRWFVLTEDLLSYHDGALEGVPQKEKGRIILKNVRCIEKVDAEALPNLPLAFQVAYNDIERRSYFTLIVVTVNESQQKEWMDLLREACTKQGASFMDKYHPGVYSSKHGFSCCNNINRDNHGCIESTYVDPLRNTSCHDNETGRAHTPSGGAIVAANNNSAITSSISNASSTTTTTTSATAANANNNTTSLLRNHSKRNKILVAQYSFDTNETNHIELIKGESYELLDNTNHDWWFVKNREAGDGYAPANFFICGTNILENFDWFFDDMSRLQSEHTLLKEDVPGCFIVRNSSRHGYSISILTTNKAGKLNVKHYHINRLEDPIRFYISDSHYHDSLEQLVAYHKHNRGRLCQRLTHPPIRKGRPETVGFAANMNEIKREHLEILNILGKGNFGCVRKAIYTPQCKEVAVKMMNEETMNEQDFIQEAKNMKHFSHNRLVQLYGICSDQRPIYIVSEYMCNGSLEKYLRINRNILFNSHNTMVDYSIQIASAMAYLESEKFIHRDLAARNCLVGEDNIVKVADFGLTRYVLDDIYTSRQGAKFPIKWSAPEVLEFSLFSSKSDVWAFGIVMWEIWTCGDTPFLGISNDETTRLVCYKNSTPDQPQYCNNLVYSIMKNCWQRKSESRPSFTQLISSLNNLVEEED